MGLCSPPVELLKLALLFIGMTAIGTSLGVDDSDLAAVLAALVSLLSLLSALGIAIFGVWGGENLAAALFSVFAFVWTLGLCLRLLGWCGNRLGS